MSIIDIVRKFLLDEKYLEKNDVVGEKDSLLEMGLIDSVGIMNLVKLLEDTYKIEIDDDDLMPENFDTLVAIENYVKSRLS